MLVHLYTLLMYTTLHISIAATLATATTAFAIATASSSSSSSSSSSKASFTYNDIQDAYNNVEYCMSPPSLDMFTLHQNQQHELSHDLKSTSAYHEEYGPIRPTLHHAISSRSRCESLPHCNTIDRLELGGHTKCCNNCQWRQHSQWRREETKNDSSNVDDNDSDADADADRDNGDIIDTFTQHCDQLEAALDEDENTLWLLKLHETALHNPSDRARWEATVHEAVRREIEIMTTDATSVSTSTTPIPVHRRFHLYDVIRGRSGREYYSVVTTRRHIRHMRHHLSDIIDAAVVRPRELKVSAELQEEMHWEREIEKLTMATVKQHDSEQQPSSLEALHSVQSQLKYVNLHVSLSPAVALDHDHADAIATRWYQQFSRAFPDIIVDSRGTDDGEWSSFRITAEHDQLIRVWGVPRRHLVTIVHQHLVTWLETSWIELYHHYHVRMEYAPAIVQSGKHDDIKPFWGRSIQGQGQIIGATDSGMDYDSCYFSDTNVKVEFTDKKFTSSAHRKLVRYTGYADTKAGETKSHGTHVAGCAAAFSQGSGNSDIKGTAYMAKLVFFDIGIAGTKTLDIPGSLVSSSRKEGMFADAYKNGARVHTNSWGADANIYTTHARDTDTYAHKNKDMLIIVAAGNTGLSGPRSIGSPGTSKNCLTVGASLNFIKEPNLCADAQVSRPCENNVAQFSSLGPTFDGRIAPDVVAPGHSIKSAASTADQKPHCGVYTQSGTSMSAPVLAGGAALLRQYFLEGYYPVGIKGHNDAVEPSGAILKALMINAGDVLSGKHVRGGRATRLVDYPSIIQGFGRTNLNNAVRFAEDKESVRMWSMGFDHRRMPELNTGQKHSYTIKATPDAVEAMGSRKSELKITLVWMDKEAASGATQALVNNLDLIVETDNGNGKVLPVNGLSDGSRDVVNVVEQLRLAATDDPLKPNGKTRWYKLAYGEYKITVKGTAVPQGPQPYALVVTGPFELTPELYTSTGVPLVKPATTLYPINEAKMFIDGEFFAKELVRNRVTLKCEIGKRPESIQLLGAESTPPGKRIAINVKVGFCRGEITAYVQVDEFVSAPAVIGKVDASASQPKPPTKTGDGGETGTSSSGTPTPTTTTSTSTSTSTSTTDPNAPPKVKVLQNKLRVEGFVDAYRKTWFNGNCQGRADQVSKTCSQQQDGTYKRFACNNGDALERICSLSSCASGVCGPWKNVEQKTPQGQCLFKDQYTTTAHVCVGGLGDDKAAAVRFSPTLVVFLTMLVMMVLSVVVM